MTDEARTELKGTVFHLKDLIGYQDGAVSSRMILSRPVGNITLFSFDKDEGLSEHTAPYDAVVTILEGKCEIRLSGETFGLKEGETIIFPAGAPHAVSAVTRFKMMLTMIRE
ncbi:MAG: cupin domain-containing protein [Methanomicrobiaceae archaeon]|nr:cupin domain-containing protein [Methanomicrobiaceae archaeon]